MGREPLIAAWKAQHSSVSGHQGRYAMREIVNALRYQNRTGCLRELLPHDLPPTGAVRYHFDVWKRDGLDWRINDVLRMMVREKAGRPADPSLVVLDSQSVRVASGVPKSAMACRSSAAAPHSSITVASRAYDGARASARRVSGGAGEQVA